MSICFYKQKPAYEMRISDWSSDVCSSDLPALLRLAEIVRGADTARLDLAPQAAGLLAMSLGLSAIHDSDEAMLERGMTLYDALYGWCRFATEETHNWPVPPQPMAAAPEYRA